MQNLQYQNDAVWARLPLADFRPRFFVESYIEKLRIHTPHFYQARLLNIFSACSEMIVYIESLQVNSKNGGYVVSSLEEIVDCWESDPIAQEIISEFASLSADLVKKVKAGEIDQNTQLRLRALCRAVLCRQENYVTALIAQLEDAILGTADLSQKDRVAKLIDRLTGLYTTHLLNQGYSPTYLYNRSAMFLRDNNYGDRDFAGQFRQVTSRLRHQQSLFEVYYGFHTARPSVFLSVADEPDLEFLSEIPNDITAENLEKFKKNISINVVVKVAATATDYVTAALRVKERLDRFLDAELALEFSKGMQISAHCVTINRQSPQLTHIKTLNVDVLLEFMSSEVGTSFSQSITPIRHSFKSLNDDSKEQLARSLRHLRLARNSVSVEQKLLNLWIALESLFGNAGNSIIGNILEFVPQFYAITGLGRRVAYLRELLSANEIEVTPIIRADICPGLLKFDASVTDAQIFVLLRSEKAAIELFNSIKNKEHLKFKLMKIFAELKNNKSILARIDRSEADVGRQLRRIYFLRNKIAHTGHFRDVRPQLVTNLLDYVAISYRAISVAASKTTQHENYSIPELLAASRMGVDLVTARVSSKDEVTALEQITLLPVI
jgi:hypothetical protein